MIKKIKQIRHAVRRRCAKFWRGCLPGLKVVGVTGSYGKTSAVYAIDLVLKSRYSTLKTDQNLDTIYNLPITLLKLRPSHRYLVAEYGVDHRREMSFHLDLVKPDIAVFTGITPVHADKDHIGSLDNIIFEKKQLTDAAGGNGLAIFNYDDPYVAKVADAHKGRKYTYGFNNKADFRAKNIYISPQRTTFTLTHDGKEVPIKTGLIGYPAVYACLAAFCVGAAESVPDNKIVAALKELKPMPGRLSVEPGPLQTTLVNDAKRANPASVSAGLQTLANFSGRKVVVLGEMGELGEHEEEMHRHIGKVISALPLDMVVGVGPLTEYILKEAAKQGFPESKLKWVPDVYEAATVLKRQLQPDDLLYLKASLLRHLERVTLILEGKTVTCRKVVCHRYEPCSTCPLLSSCVQS